jgi:hypothetical protein
MRKLMTIMALIAVLLSVSAFADVTEAQLDQMTASSGGAGGSRAASVLPTSEANILIAISDDSNSSAIMIGMAIIDNLRNVGYTIPAGNVKLFSEVNAETVGTTYPLTIAIHDNLVMQIQGEGYSFEQVVFDALDAAFSANARVYSLMHYSSIYKSDLMTVIDDMMCPTTVHAYCDENTAIREYSYFEYEQGQCISRGGSAGSEYCGNGCFNGNCIQDNEIVHQYKFYQGWNLFPVGQGIDFISGADNFGDLEDHIKAAYIWSPEDGEYYDLFTNPGEDVLDQIQEDVAYTAVWVYLDQSFDVKIKVNKDTVHNRLKLIQGDYKQGWNFLVYLPEMYEDYDAGHFNFYNKANTTNGDVDLVLRDGKVFAWDINSWESGYYTEITMNDDYNNDAGMPFITYYTEDFTPYMQYSSEPVIPGFPA